ncbi:MAG: hypothetical protein ACIAS6_09270 [Phycisphaerales bacterium JB060]
MKCPGCEYELWNLKAGPCPECGRPFKPSEFDFLANAVKFCCPSCQQAYYGTGEHGELVPGEFDCVSCGRHLTTDDMLLLPADELGKREATRFSNPWLDSHKGAFSKWFATVGASIGQPGKLIEATPAIGSTSKALGFALINVLVAGLFGLICVGASLFNSGGGGAMALSTVAGLLTPMLYLFLWAATTHGLLKLLRTDTPDGLSRTVQAIAFGSGGWIMAIIPCVGPLAGFPAWCVGATIAVSAGHKVAGWKASLATLALPVLTVLAVIGLYIAMIFGAFYTASSMSTTYATGHAWASSTRLEWETVDLANELRNAIQASTPPTHGAALLGPNSPVMFTVFGDAQDYDAPIGPHTAMSLDAMDDTARAAALGAITSAWPADVTAHRIGNIVFTHHGIKPGDDPRLWVLIELPDTSIDPIADAVHLSGASQLNTRTNAQSVLDQQNRLRLKAGLPPLPDYQTLTASDGPWTAADGTPPPATPGVP